MSERSPQDVYDDLSDDKFIILNGFDSYYQRRRIWLICQEYTLVITRNENDYASIRNWCKENCSDLVVYGVNGSDNGSHDMIYFSNEEDAMAFKLRWL